MVGPRQEAQPALFYEFSFEDYFPQNNLLRSIYRFVDFSGIRTYLADFYSHTGRPSVNPDSNAVGRVHPRTKATQDAGQI